jgi:ubiquitin C-terminal hydrolase
MTNIGNTCYMNSAMQCLMGLGVLQKVFTGEDFKQKINENNPLGSKGTVALAFKHFVTDYFKDSENKLNPKRFKSLIVKHMQYFENNEQHDSQEFVSQLLDTLHEDLNLVFRKPFVENLEGKLGDEEESLARKSWVNFLKRNLDDLVMNFYGQFRSLVQCQQCQNTSLTYDPFSIVTLSIPILKMEEAIVIYLKQDF